MALGGIGFAADRWTDARAADILAVMELALQHGLNQLDTAADYGKGTSERLVGQFITGRRDQLFVASKAIIDEMSSDLMLDQVNQSQARLKTDVIDLYYI